MAASSSARLDPEPALSSSSTTSEMASLASVSRSLARSRMSSTKSFVSSTMSSRNRVRVFLRFDMGGGPFGSYVSYASRNRDIYTLRKSCQVGSRRSLRSGGRGGAAFEPAAQGEDVVL